MPTDLLEGLDLYVNVLAHIEAFPDTWNQHSWVTPPDCKYHAKYFQPFKPPCGTAFCFAGHVAKLDGRWLRFNGADTLVSDTTSQHEYEYELTVSEYARRRLGLDGQHSYTLFSALNTLDDLYRLVAHYAGIKEADLRTKVHEQAELLRDFS